jgi:uncharacterized membrane protein
MPLAPAGHPALASLVGIQLVYACPERRQRRLPTGVIPHARRNDASLTRDAVHLREPPRRIGHEVHDELCKRGVEFAVGKGELLCRRTLDVDARMALAGGNDELLRGIDRSHLVGPEPLDENSRQRTGAAADVQDALPGVNTRKVRKLRRQSRGVPAHEPVVRVSGHLEGHRVTLRRLDRAQAGRRNETQRRVLVFTRTKTNVLKENATSAAEFATALAKDKKFRRELAAAVTHGTIARRRAARKIGLLATVSRITGDPKLRRELDKVVKSLDKAWSRVERKRSHKLRNTLIVGGVAGAAAAAVPLKRWLSNSDGGFSGTMPRTLDESIDVNVPVSTVYNQWTQFEDFPLFMEGVEHVQQLDDTRLRWVSTIGGKTNEWRAKILEQHPDRQISWISEDGKKTRGTVTFEPIGENKTRVRLSMSYQADPLEAVGSAAGIDSRRIRGDIERFKELIESRGSETGAWRGEVSAGQKQSS